MKQRGRGGGRRRRKGGCAQREERGQVGIEEQTADGCNVAASINIGRNGWKPSALAEAPTAAPIMPAEKLPYGEAGGHRKDITSCTPAHLGLFMQYK